MATFTITFRPFVAGWVRCPLCGEAQLDRPRALASHVEWHRPAFEAGSVTPDGRLAE